MSLEGHRPSQPAIGDIVAGKYRVEGVLGEGGMGVVLRATHLELDCPVALKLVRSELAQNEQAISRILQEARALAQLRCEHVARVLDVGRLEGGNPFIVLEYLQGLNLAALLEGSGCPPVAKAVDYVLQTCEALAEAHGAGIIHRDLKPENLFLAASPDGDMIKVLDFGISKQITKVRRSIVTNPATVLGSPHYMAPEQMRTPDAIDARADIWSLGAILFELLTQQPAFDAESIPAVCAMVLDQDPPKLREINPRLPAGLEAVVAHCLQKQRERRFADVAELARALASFGSVESPARAARAERLLARGGAVRVTTLRSNIHIPNEARRAVNLLRPSVWHYLRTVRDITWLKTRTARGRVLGLAAILFAAAGVLTFIGTAKSREHASSSLERDRGGVPALSKVSEAADVPKLPSAPVTAHAAPAKTTAATPPPASVRLRPRAPRGGGESVQRAPETREPEATVKAPPGPGAKRLDPYDPNNFGGRL
jgi:serine/threonine-protein kinase